MTNLVRGVGINDLQCKRDGKHDREYILWHCILTRCYGKNPSPRNSSYSDCEVSEDWKIYSNFKKDVSKLVGYDQDGWHIDKDILGCGRKLYSKNTCCFVPADINCFFTYRRKTNTNGYIGVGHDKDAIKNPYVVKINKNGKQTYFGRFSNPEEASFVYKKEKLNYLRELAERYKDRLDERVYNTLISIDTI